MSESHLDEDDEDSVLLPCPFCGSTNIRVLPQDAKPPGRSWMQVDCVDCGALKRIVTAFEVQARAEWNQRPAGTDLGAAVRLARARAEIAILRSQVVTIRNEYQSGDQKMLLFREPTGETEALHAGPVLHGPIAVCLTVIGRLHSILASLDDALMRGRS